MNMPLSETIHFLSMYWAFLIVVDFLTFSYTSRYIPASWNNIKSPLLLYCQSWLNALCARASYSFQNNWIMTINELRDKPVWQMTGEELLFLAQHDNISTSRELTKASSSKEEKRYVYGLAGIACLFGCSLPTASRIKQSGKINRAITQIGRKIIVDADLALELAGRKTGGRWWIQLIMKTFGESRSFM